MNQHKKRSSIAAAMACALTFGATGAALITQETVSAEDVSMTAILGETTGDVSVSATTDGLKFTREAMDSTWESEIDVIFTGNTTISYTVSGYGNFNEGVNDAPLKNGHANAFTVRNTYDEVVARFFLTNKHWNNTFASKAFIYDAIEDVYTTAKAVDSKIVEGEYTTLSDDTIKNMNYLNMFAPSSSDTPTLKEGASGVGAVYFDYAEGKLSLKTSTYDLAGKTGDVLGNGQIVTLGEVEVDLSEGYTISIGSGSNLKMSDGSQYSFPCTANVKVKAINDFATTATTAATSAHSEISYAGEYTEEDKNVISVYEGSKLNKFYYTSATQLQDAAGHTLLVNPEVEMFDYAGNKAFTANEDITVSYRGMQKAYTVRTNASFGNIDVTDLVGAKTDGTGVAASKSYNGASAVAGRTVTGLKVGQFSTAAWSATLNGTFTGNSSLTYYLPDRDMYDSEMEDGVHVNNRRPAANAFTIKDASGNAVAIVVNASVSWASTGGGKAYVYDVKANKYTTKRTWWTDNTINCYADNEDLVTCSVVTTAEYGLNNMCMFDDMFTAKVGMEHSNNVEDLYSTLYLEYSNKTLKIKVSTYNVENRGVIGGELKYSNASGRGQIITIGKIENVDLDAGYTISVGSAPDITGTDGSTFKYIHSSSVLINKINGVDVSKAKATATSVSENIVYDGALTGGEIVIEKGDTLSFTSDTVAYLGSMAYKKAGVTVKTAFGENDYGKTFVVKAEDFAGSKHFDVRVKGLAETLTAADVKIAAGASIRSEEPYGIKFKLQITSEAQAKIAEAWGAGKAYAGVKFGMAIVPYSYVGTYGDLTEETLFGENAIYTWKGKTEGKVDGTQIMLSYSTNGLVQDTVDGGYKLEYSNVGLSGAAVTEKFIAIGFIELEKADGTKEYKVVANHAGYAEGGNAETNLATCVRSCYDVAVLAYESDKTSTALKEFLLANYLTPNGYQANTEEGE